MNPMYCDTCHRVEDDPITLDVEICGACGGFLSAYDPDDGQPEGDDER